MKPLHRVRVTSSVSRTKTTTKEYDKEGRLVKETITESDAPQPHTYNGYYCSSCGTWVYGYHTCYGTNWYRYTITPVFYSAGAISSTAGAASTSNQISTNEVTL